MSSLLARLAAKGIAPAIALTALVGCTSSGLERADRLFTERAYADAADAYRTVLDAGKAGLHKERALFQLALAHASPGSPIYDEARARELFRELVDRVDAGPYRAQAARILELESLRDELREEARRRRQEAEATLAEASALSQDAERSQEALEELRRTLERLDGEVAACREQLEKLKAIDLGGTL